MVLGRFPDLWQVKVLPDNFVLILSHRSILTSSNKLARKKGTQQEIIYFVYKKLITYAFKIIKEKIIQTCFKTFMGRIEFKFVLFLFYHTPLYACPYLSRIFLIINTILIIILIPKVNITFLHIIHPYLEVGIKTTKKI